MIDNILIGSDPEVFIKDKNTGEIGSAIGLIPGSKDFPFAISDEGHAVQTDNVMVEFCVPASNNAEKLNADIRYCLQVVNEMLPNNFETVVKASAFLKEELLNNEQAQTFGCDPDYNAYSLTQNDAPSSKTNLRSAGGHVHIGYDNPDFDTNISIIRALDLFLGIPSVDLDTDIDRKKMYGKAGAFRQKPYGVEYRTLSNFWIENEQRVTWLVNQVKNAIQFINEGNVIPDEDQAKIQLAINNSDHALASHIAKKYNILFTYDVIKLMV